MLSLLLYPSTSEERKTVVEKTVKLLDAFLEASRNDPYLASLGVPDPSHCHGWGYVVIWGTGMATWGLEYARGDEGSCSANLSSLEKAVRRVKLIVERESWGNLLLVVHSRRAGRSEPRGSLHAHPHFASIVSRHGLRTYYFAHNGSIRKDALAKIIGVDPNSYTDTAIGFYWLVKRLSYGGDLAQLYGMLATYTRTALNTILVEHFESNASMTITSYITPGLDRERVKYYEAFMVSEPGMAGYASSTIRDIVGSTISMEKLDRRIVVVEWGKGVVKTTSF